MKYLIGILLVIIFLSCSQEETLTPTKIVSLKQGDLIGYEKDDTEYFLGVPYAEAPVNDFRFKTPQSHEGWDGILNCLLYTSPSPRDRTRSRMPSSA